MKELRTRKCRRHRHPEFVLRYDAPALDADAEGVREYLEDAVAAGSRFLPGQTVLFGWTLMRVESEPEGLLTLSEPDFASMPIAWAPGITRALVHTRVQFDTADSVGLARKMAPANLQCGALICTRLASAKHLWMDRMAPMRGRDSGWFIGCADATHNHQESSELMLQSLYELSLHQPAVIPFLALPEGVAVKFSVEPTGGVSSLELWLGEKKLEVGRKSLLAALQGRFSRRA